MADLPAEQQWRDLCRELRERQEAELRCQLFENGVLVRERLQEWERARVAVEETRRRIDAFIREQLRAK